MEPIRIRQIDALRSFALGGILMVNIWYFADPYTLAGDISPNQDSAADLAVRFAVAVLFEAKFYLLFSFLFGYSFVLQWRKAAAAGVPPGHRMLRRLAALGVLGLLHGIVLFFGDILLTYSLMGLILLAVHPIRASSAVIAGSALVGVIGSVILAIGLFLAVDPAGTAPAGIAVDAGRLTASPASAFSANAEYFFDTVAGVVLLQGPLSLGMFYLGLAAARTGLLERQIPARTLTMTAIGCLPVGLGAGVLQAYLTIYVNGDRFGVLAVGISTLTAPLLTAGYISLLLLAFRTTAGSRLCSFLAPAGRMALTNYLMQSVIMALVFTAYGLRLADRLPAAAVAGIAVVVFAGQLLCSRILLSHRRTGPAEWLLRRVSYGGQQARAARN